MEKDDLQNWYKENKHIYDLLCQKVHSIITDLINDASIPVHAIYSRTKDLKSLLKKVDKNKYSDPRTQLTDVSGFRIITYVESDLEKVSKIIGDCFYIDKENSIDKGEVLGIDKVGYKSIHFIAKLSDDRVKMPEFKKFKDLKFEIQIRTILQHAWAEIEHDRNYKFTGVLPHLLQRRFKVLAGVLELADREFNNIAKAIDEHSKNVAESTTKGELAIPLDSTSIKSFTAIKFKKLFNYNFANDFNDDSYEKNVLNELELMGINTLADLNKIIPDDLVEKEIEYEVMYYTKTYPLNLAGLLRNVMMIHDSDRYFKECWKRTWTGIDDASVELLKSYNVDIDKLIREYDLDVLLAGI
jgi:putative GTP pyrophosphokinase